LIKSQDMHDITQLWGMCIIGKEKKKKRHLSFCLLVRSGQWRSQRGAQRARAPTEM